MTSSSLDSKPDNLTSRLAHLPKHIISQPGSLELSPLDAHKVQPSNFWLQLYSQHSGHSTLITFTIPEDFSDLIFTSLMEVQRQAGTAFAHRTLGVPHTEAFILKSMTLSRDSPAPQNSSPTRAGTIQIQSSNSKVTNGVLKQTEVLSEIQNANGTSIFHGSLASSFVSKEIYERIRARSNKQIGTTDDCDVCRNVSSRGISINTEMPKLRDHDSDHLAAIEIVAAIEEGINTNFSSEIVGLSISFYNYVELEPLPAIHFFSISPNLVAGCIHQGHRLRTTFQAETTHIGSRNDDDN